MKKLIALMLSMFLMVGCVFMTACGEGEPDETPYNPQLDVTNDAFYANVLEAFDEINSLTFSGQMTLIEEGEQETFDLAGGVDLSGTLPTVAVEYGNTQTEYEIDGAFYLYHNIIYFADGFKGLETNGAWEYWYDVTSVEEYLGNYGDGDIVGGDLVGEGVAVSSTWAQMVLAYLMNGTSGNDMIDEYLGMFKDIIPVTEAEQLALTKETVELFFTTTQTENGFAISYDSQKLKTFYTNLSTKTISEFIDVYEGANTYLEAKTQITALLDSTVNELYTSIDETMGGTLNQTLITALTTSLGMTTEEVEQMITAGLTTYGNMKIKTLIATFAEIEEAEIVAIVNNAFTTCETTTPFDAIGLLAGYGEQSLAIKKATITAMVNEYADDITAVINLDAEGNFKNVEITVNTVYEDLTVSGEFTVEFNKKFADVATKVAEIQAGYDAQASAHIGIWKFENLTLILDEEFIEYNVGDEAPWGDDILDENYYVLEIKEDGTYSSSSIVDGNVVNQTGTWVEEYGLIILALEGQEVYCQVEDGKLFLGFDMAEAYMSYILTK